MEDLEKLAEKTKWINFDKGGYAHINNPHFDIIFNSGFEQGYKQANEWISVDTALPEGYTECLGYFDGNQWTLVFDGEEWIKPEADYEPTHWMPLPPKPE